MGFLAALASLAGPLTARVLMALGFSVVTIGGVSVAIDAVKAEVLAQLGGAQVAMLQLAGLGGAWVALGWIFGAMSFAVSYWGITQARRVLGVA